jgi:hypothetical protein
MLSQETAALQIQIWPIDKLVFYGRNPRKNDAAVDRMCASIREFGFKIPVLAPATARWWTDIFGLRPRGSWSRGRAAIPRISP